MYLYNIGYTSTKIKQFDFVFGLHNIWIYLPVGRQVEQSMNGLVLRSVGIKRAKGIIGLINFTYNLFRYEQVVRLNIV